MQCIGHKTAECTEKRVLDKSNVADMSAEAAWDLLQKADEEKDLDDFRTVSSEISRSRNH